jgi:phosphinothricin acetyltransferase
MAEASPSQAIDAARIRVRYGEPGDAAALNDLYDHYIQHTPITFDLEPWSLEQRLAWLSEFKRDGPHRLIVAEHEGTLLGYASSHRFREKAAYSTTVETSIYCRHDVTGKGVGSLLYGALFEALKGESLHLAVAGVTLPNDASVAIHRRFGFEPVGVYHAVGRKFGRYWDVAWFEKPLP